MEIIHAIILAIVEGLTEFLPVSSTGHMILTSVFIGLKTDDEFLKVFEVCIQFGAILSVVLVYFKRFFKSFDFYFKLLAAFIPTAILGLLLSDFIDSLLENVIVVALMLLVGGVILLFVDNWFKNNEVEGDIEVNSDSLDSPVVSRKIKEDVSYLNAFFIGLAQSVAMIPGVSRSAASIIGGLSQGITRKAAAEFSFFLAVPTMFAATAKKLYDFSKQPELMNSMMEHINLLIIGNVVAFIVALIAIRFFISILTKYGFKFFGYYRIVLGAGILVMLMLDYDLKMV